MRTPPTTEEQLFDPFTFLNGEKAKPVPAPSLAAGERKVDDGDFGSVSWFLMLASHVDERLALKAVDGWGGDAYVAYQSAGRTCMKVQLLGDAVSDGDEMAAALTSWSAAFPKGTATITHDGATVDLRSCDPGAATPPPDARSRTGSVLPATRTNFATGTLESHVPEPLARCAANHWINAYTAASWRPTSSPRAHPIPRSSACKRSPPAATPPDPLPLRRCRARCRTATRCARDPDRRGVWPGFTNPESRFV